MPDKYALFRNYMVNELGVTREDIETWTKESIRIQVEKLVGQLNIEDVAYRAAYSLMSQPLYGLKQHIVNEVAKQIEVKLVAS